jgi:Ca2+-binding RTX toxin-like protein
MKKARTTPKGNTSDDTLIGTDGNDRLKGHKGDDVLIGARGEDRLSGGKGDDYLSGNQGRDQLTGGKGADVFVFDGDFDQDTVRDFRPGQGDTMQFVLYGAEQRSWTAETLLGFFEQRGANAVLSLPASDETVTLRKVAVASLGIDDFDLVQFGPEPDPLLA